MTTEQHAIMHRQHRDAQSELNSWIDDVYNWQAEHKQALAWLAHVEAAIRELDIQLQKHKLLIEKQERHVREHEHEIAIQEQHQRFETHTPLVDQHEVFSEEQTRLRDAHGKVGEHHRKQVAHLKQVYEEFTNA